MKLYKKKEIRLMVRDLVSNLPIQQINVQILYRQDITKMEVSV